MNLSKWPIIYEINTWVWLNELGRKHGTTMTLGRVPDEEWDALAILGMDAVWLMGVWERSPAGIAIASLNEGLMTSFRQALPDFTAADNVGSPYCIRSYAVDSHLGGNSGLAAARESLAHRGIGLILDFVPNHVAPDHPWVVNHPEYFIQGSPADLATEPEFFCEAAGTVFACGRDPFFPAWPDVLQLNAFSAGLRQAAAATLLDIAARCDGVRCDMAMLLLNAIFERTWGWRAGARPDADYWSAIIPAVKSLFPDFTFIAEAYWDLEWELQQQGFDFCYDKRLYDRLEKESADPVRLHLLADMAYQGKLLRFIENHDEPRAAATFRGHYLQAAAVAALTLPGAKLLHEGQLEGRRVRLPVFLARRPPEIPDEHQRAFYSNLLKAICDDVFKTGEWHLCECNGWPDNLSNRNLVAWCWRLGKACRIVVVNLSETPSQGRIRLPWEDMRDKSLSLKEIFSGCCYTRTGNEMMGSGLFIDLAAWGYHLFVLDID